MTSSVTLDLPHPVLTPFGEDHDPTAKQIRQLKREICANASAVESTRGGGNNGHLGMAMGAADYANVDPTAWVQPPNPQRPPILGLTAAQATAVFAQCQDEKEECAVAKALGDQCKAAIPQAVPHEYLNSLAHDLRGFAGVAAPQMITHLEVTCGAITHEDLTANELALTTPWDPTTPTETVFDRVNEIRAFATAGNDNITALKAMRETLKVFKNSGVLADACKDWDKVPEANKTLPAMRLHFKTHNKRRIKDQTTASENGHNKTNPPNWILSRSSASKRSLECCSSADELSTTPC